MNLPTPFIDYTRALLGNEAYEQLAASLQQPSPVSIRLNLVESGKLKHAASCEQQNKLPWCADGFYLDQRLTFTFDPLFHAGCYYVQEASSMFVEQVLKRYVGDAPSVMLDLCAAPGGKSTHARTLLPTGSLLVANELIRNRSQILAENLTKWGHPGVVVTNNDPSDFARLEHFFDVILTDVPCSGEGMFRKDPGAIDEWSPENVEICWKRQRRIIADIWPCLKPGGILIYSTCTYNTQENEENVQWISQTYGVEVLPVDVEPTWNITGNLLEGTDFPVYRFLPHHTRGEGFFLAALRKPDEENKHFPINAPKKKKRGGAPSPSLVSKEQLSMVKNWLTSPDAFTFSVDGTLISAFPTIYNEVIATLQESLRIVQAGITLAEVKGKDTIPCHALAMSLSMKSGVFPTEEVSYEQAIAYLRKEAISLSETAPRGYVLLTYQTVPLGFVKNIGNRANNLYPSEWRIRSGYLPEEVRTLLPLTP